MVIFTGDIHCALASYLLAMSTVRAGNSNGSIVQQSVRKTKVSRAGLLVYILATYRCSQFLPCVFFHVFHKDFMKLFANADGALVRNILLPSLLVDGPAQGAVLFDYLVARWCWVAQVTLQTFGLVYIVPRKRSNIDSVTTSLSMSWIPKCFPDCVYHASALHTHTLPCLDCNSNCCHCG